MPIATLLLREDSSTSLTLLVEKSQQQKQPLLNYNLHLNTYQLDLILVSKSHFIKDDEGFESDIDSLSIVSNESETTTKTITETDSANGSASSDSDTEHHLVGTSANPTDNAKETFNLVDCCCYTDVKCPDLLIFVIKKEAFVFKFGNLNELKNFYVNFSALKAVTNQKTYNNFNAKFNLLHRTDNNGVTHIEITREPTGTNSFVNHSLSSIISLNTPEYVLDRTKNVCVKTPKNNLKVWNSAEDLLAVPKRPERRKKIKPKAPQPPLQQNVLSGQYVRVNVSSSLKKEAHPKKLTQNWTNSVPRLVKSPRSKSETRNFTPMAYRYIDTTTTYPSYYPNTLSNLNNRLFGLSPKLRDFSQNNEGDKQWESSRDGNLKSVIKNKETKKKNEKKVTFSAYTTVQVV